MTSLTSLIEEVYALTNRPDRVGETALAVRNATLKAHSQDFFYKDIVETGISFDYEQAQQSLEYKLLVPRWRAFKYLRKYLPSNTGGAGTPREFLEFVTPENILDSYSCHKENICYMAGAEIQIRSRDASKYFLLGCYVFPDVTPKGYNSWIADEQPAAIIYEATATVFKTIGYDEQSSAYQQLAREEYMLLKENNVQAIGY